jgi:hypothetical protein
VVRKNLVLGGHSVCKEILINISFHYQKPATFSPEDGASMSLRNVDIHLQVNIGIVTTVKISNLKQIFVVMKTEAGTM